MKCREEDIRKVEEALKSAHGRRKNLEVSHQWRSNVMRHIRRLDTEKTGFIHRIALFDQLVWRFACATCLIAGVFLIYTLLAGSSLEHQMAEVVMEDPAGFMIAQAFGL